VYGHSCLRSLWEFFFVLPFSTWQHNITLSYRIESKVVFRKCNDNEKPKKKSEKREMEKDRWYNQMEQVGTGLSTWNRYNRDRGNGLSVPRRGHVSLFLTSFMTPSSLSDKFIPTKDVPLT